MRSQTFQNRKHLLPNADAKERTLKKQKRKNQEPKHAVGSQMFMMFGDDRQTSNMPWVTWSACIVTTAIYLIQTSSNTTALYFMEYFSFIPADFSMHPAINFYRLFSATLLHGGLTHILGNLLFFFVLGRSIENAIGPLIFGFTFFGLGALAFLGSWLINPDSTTPIIGNSGAVSFLLGGYVVLFPKAKIFIIPMIKKFWIRPWLFALVWFAPQMMNAFDIGEILSGTAYWTHFGGFLIGLLSAAAWKELGEDTLTKLERLQPKG